jgi:hypothetical protein
MSTFYRLWLEEIMGYGFNAIRLCFCSIICDNAGLVLEYDLCGGIEQFS